MCSSHFCDADSISARSGAKQRNHSFIHMMHLPSRELSPCGGCAVNRRTAACRELLGLLCVLGIPQQKVSVYIAREKADACAGLRRMSHHRAEELSPGISLQSQCGLENYDSTGIVTSEIPAESLSCFINLHTEPFFPTV